jgi:glycerol-3-phosphate dehydrogenase
LIDHRHHGGVTGLISLISVRYTVARRDAVDALDLAGAQLGGRETGCESSSRPLPGGNIDDFAKALRDFSARRPGWLPVATAEALLRNYGTHAVRILSLAESEPRLARCFSGTEVTYAEALYAVRAEMAQRMTDVVLRRTGMGTNGHPGARALDEMQDLLRHELSWSDERVAEERAALERHFDRFLATAPYQQERPARSA